MIVIALARLVRLPNLTIVALTQFLLYYFVFYRHFQEAGIEARLGLFHFSQLILVTVLLTAGGYVINDIMDVEADRVNKPEKMIISRYIRRRSALWLYFCTQTIGFFLAIYLSFYVQNLRLLFLYPTAAIGLYAYSSYFKRRPFLGHLLIALYCGGVALVVWLSEQPGFLELQELAPELAQFLANIVLAYALFAFLTTLLRELIKVMEDEAGDRQANYRTTVIAWGAKRVRIICVSLAVVLLLLMGGYTHYFSNYFTNWKTVLVASILAVPTLLIIYQLSRLSHAHHFKRLSQLTKLLMLLGVLVLFSFA